MSDFRNSVDPRLKIWIDHCSRASRKLGGRSDWHSWQNGPKHANCPLSGLFFEGLPSWHLSISVRRYFPSKYPSPSCSVKHKRFSKRFSATHPVSWEKCPKQELWDGAHFEFRIANFARATKLNDMHERRFIGPRLKSHCSASVCLAPHRNGQSYLYWDCRIRLNRKSAVRIAPLSENRYLHGRNRYSHGKVRMSLVSLYRFLFLHSLGCAFGCACVQELSLRVTGLPYSLQK